MDAVEALQDSLSISTSDALKTLLRQSIKGMNVNLDYEFPLAETAIEILGCMRLVDKLNGDSSEMENTTKSVSPSEIKDAASEPVKPTILTDLEEIVEFIADRGTKLVHGLINIDKNSTYINIEDKSIGSLPKDVEDIINIFDVKIHLYEIVLWIDSGNEGVLGWGEMSNGRPAGVAIFDRSKNIYGLVEGSKIWEEDKSNMEERWQKMEALFEKLGPMIQEKILDTFPELADLQ